MTEFTKGIVFGLLCAAIFGVGLLHLPIAVWAPIDALLGLALGMWAGWRNGRPSALSRRRHHQEP